MIVGETLKLQYASILIIIALAAILSTNYTQSEIGQESEIATEKLRGWKVRTARWALAETFELKIGDLILSVNGSPFTASNDDFQKLKEHCGAGKPVSIVFERDGKTYTRVRSLELSTSMRPKYEHGANVLDCDYLSQGSEAQAGEPQARH